MSDPQIEFAPMFNRCSRAVAEIDCFHDLLGDLDAVPDRLVQEIAKLLCKAALKSEGLLAGAMLEVESPLDRVEDSTAIPVRHPAPVQGRHAAVDDPIVRARTFRRLQVQIPARMTDRGGVRPAAEILNQR